MLSSKFENILHGWSRGLRRHTIDILTRWRSTDKGHMDIAYEPQPSQSPVFKIVYMPIAKPTINNQKKTTQSEHSQESSSCAAELIVDFDSKSFSILPVLLENSSSIDGTACSIEDWEFYIRVMRQWGVCWEGLGEFMTMCHSPPANVFADESCPEPFTIVIQEQTLYYRRHPSLPGDGGFTQPLGLYLIYMLCLFSFCAQVVYLAVALGQSLAKWRRRHLLKSVPSRRMQLSWRCSCGDFLFGDYQAKDEKKLMEFDTKLQEISALPTKSLSWQVPEFFLPTEFHSNSPQKEYTAPTQAINQSPQGHIHVSSTKSWSPQDSISLSKSVSQSGTRDSKSDLRDGSVLESDSTAREPLRFLELCVSTNALSITLAELKLNTTAETVTTDAALFAMINREYFKIRKLRHFAFLYKPVDIQFVRFSVYAGGRVGIYEKPMSLPSKHDVTAGNYHYHECPLDPLPPIDHRTFFHYFWDYHRHMSSPSRLFLDRLPKKLNTSMHVQGAPDQLNLGWGVHIIEGPNKKAISLCVFAVVVASFVVSLTYSLVIHSQESGFGIGQWIVAVGTVGLSAIYFQISG